MANSSDIPAEIEAFAERLLEEKQLPQLEPEVRAQLKQDLVDRVETRINAELLANLSPDHVKEFEKLLDAGNETATQEFLRAKIPDIQNVVAKALLAFRAIYLQK